MDDTCRIGALLTVCIYMGHNIVAHELFSFLSHLIVDILCMSLKLVYLILCHLFKTQLMLSLCKGDPQPSPCFEFLIRRKNIFHFLIRIS